MASPFKFFRTHQTQLLVVIGILTMIAFIILPSVLQQLEVVGHARTTSNVVETQKYGNLDKVDVQRLKDRQNVLIGFFGRIAQAYQIKLNDMSQERDPEKMEELYKTYMNSMKAQQLASQVGDNSDETVVLMWLLENKAKEMGITINDAMISSFISENTEGLDEKTVNTLIYGDETKKSRDIENSLFDALNGYLLREKLVAILGASLDVNTTADGLDSFCRLNQRASIEVYPVNVKDFVGKVEAPTDDEVNSFFEKYKDKDANASSSEPGFRQPQKVALEYCYGSYEQFLDTAAITDEQIQENYNNNKENYVIENKDENQSNLKKLDDLGLDTKEYRPLDDTLKKEIRDALARVAAIEKLRTAIGVVQKAMNDYSDAKDMYDLNTVNDPNAAAPAKVDLAALAKDNKLTYVRTDLMTLQSFTDKVQAYEQSQGAEENQDAEQKKNAEQKKDKEQPLDLYELRLDGITKTVYASSEFFDDTPQSDDRLFRSKVFANPEGKLFVIWKIENVAEHTPTLDEAGVKEQVIDQVKFTKARKLAEEDAQNKVKKAIADQLPLKSCLGDESFTPPQFSWMTFGPVFSSNMQPRIYLSPVEGVRDAGYEFMTSLFQMKTGEIKAIVNDSQSVYYVVRIIDMTPTDQLYARFLVTPEAEYASARMPDFQYFYKDFREKLEKDAGLTWVDRSNKETGRE